MKAVISSNLNQQNLEAAAFLAKCMGDENRLRILSLISKEKKSVTSIVDELNISQPLASHHLKELKRALLVTVERSGPFIYYQVADQRIIDILAQVEKLATDLLRKRSAF